MGVVAIIKEISNVTNLQMALNQGEETLTEQFRSGSLQKKIQMGEIDPRTLIHKAVLEDVPELIEFLLDQGVPVDYKDKSQATPLVMAVLNRCDQTVDVLLKHNANVNEFFGGKPLLEFAMTTPNKKLGRYDATLAIQLIEHGANVNAINADKRSVLSMALQVPMVDPDYSLVKEMVNRGAKIQTDHWDIYHQPLYLVVEKGDVSLMRFFIEHGANPNFVLKHENIEVATLLHQAIYRRNLNMVKFLVESGADVNKAASFQIFYVQKVTPLGYAIYWNASDITQFLLQQGAIP